MDQKSPRWKSVTESQFPWEKDALVYVRNRLPDLDPYRAWSNFEFIADDGSVNEVDLLVLGPCGLYLVEIKSKPGRVRGSQGSWSWHADGHERYLDNPILLANRKAKRLRSLLQGVKTLRASVPYIQELVFLSAQGIRSELAPPVSSHVCVRAEDRDRCAQHPDLLSVLTAAPPPGRAAVDAATAKALTRALETGIARRAQAARRVGDYELGELLFDGPGYQDWSAEHVSLKKTVRRVRIYMIQHAADSATRQTLVRAAQREFKLLEGIEHPGILRPSEFKEHELGPALVFERHPGALRLDHYLTRVGDAMKVDLRLHLIRQIAETVEYAHQRRLTHRSLSPASVLVVDPESPTPTTKIFNWQTGVREALSQTSSGNVTATHHLERLIEDAAAVYMAPDAASATENDAMAADVFSLGALTYRLFSGEAPAASFAELQKRLAEGQGLQITGALDGAAESLYLLVNASTHPKVTARLDSVREFLKYLEDVENELTDPDREAVRDAREARPGDRLPGGFKVKKRLGQGATSVVFAVERDGVEHVLKVALKADHDATLADEAAVLKKLKWPNIPSLVQKLTVGERVGLLLESAGNETLAQRLREEGRLQAEVLERWGADLIEIVKRLEADGIPHRDIKPDNLGIREIGRGDTRRLMLFDFSLSRVPLERIRAGTPPYLDPFLGERPVPRWDLHAERYAAAVTLYQMATNTLPVWGDGRSDPASLKDACAAIEPEIFDPELRSGLTAFFQKALRRRPTERFDNADEMLEAWTRAFQAGTIPSTRGDRELDAPAPLSLEGVRPETPVAALKLSARALHALERAQVETVEALLRKSPGQVTHVRGVGHKTRRELVHLIEALGAHFPAIRPGAEAVAEPGPEAAPSAPVRNIDAIAAGLFVQSTRKSARDPAAHAVPRLLGLAGEPDDEGPAWPSQSDVARAIGCTRANVGQLLNTARKSWWGQTALLYVRDEVAALLASAGGAMTAEELAEALLASRGSVETGARRVQRALAVVRAACEAESYRPVARQGLAARWSVGRRRTSVSANKVPIGRYEASVRTLILAANEPCDGLAVIEYVDRLAGVAEELAHEEPLPAAATALARLEAVVPPEGFPPLAPDRLVRLAAAASPVAAVSSRLEIYPQKLDPVRAVRLSSGALLGVRALSIPALRARVESRFPMAAPLPGRPALDRVLADSGLNMNWEPRALDGQGAYVAPDDIAHTISTPYSSVPRRPTSFDEVGTPATNAPEAQAFEDRLVHAVEAGAFLALVVAPHWMEQAERELVARFAVDPVNLDRAFIERLRAEADRAGVAWSVVRSADAAPPDSRDWINLGRLVRRALPGLEEDLASRTRTVLVTAPGLLARYDQLGFLDRLRDRVSRATGTPGRLHGVWVLIPGDDQDERPVLAGKPVPVLSRSEWARIPRSWLANEHRAAASRTRASKKRKAPTE